MFPNDRRYTKEHEWVLNAGGVGTVGITDFAQNELGDIVFVELPEIGRSVTMGEVLGTIESVKAVAEVYTPVAGEILEINETLKDDPQSVNEDPHGDGWLVKIRFSSSSDFDELMNAEAYEAFTKEGK